MENALESSHKPFLEYIYIREITYVNTTEWIFVTSVFQGDPIYIYIPSSERARVWDLKGAHNFALRDYN